MKEFYKVEAGLGLRSHVFNSFHFTDGETKALRGQNLLKFLLKPAYELLFLMKTGTWILLSVY